MNPDKSHVFFQKQAFFDKICVIFQEKFGCNVNFENIKILLYFSHLHGSQLQKRIWAITVGTLGNHPRKKNIFLKLFYF